MESIQNGNTLRLINIEDIHHMFVEFLTGLENILKIVDFLHSPNRKIGYSFYKNCPTLFFILLVKSFLPCKCFFLAA